MAEPLVTTATPMETGLQNGFGASQNTITGSGRSLLLTVLGEFVYPSGRPVWTSSLLHVLTGIGLEEQTARQAIARGSAAGWLVGHKDGRRVRWELSPRGNELIEEGIQRVYSMSTDPPPWDGNWLVLLVTVPQSHRSVRKKLYAALSWAGFGNPTASVWVSPHPQREAEARRVIEDLALGASTLAFTGSSVSVGLDDEDIVRRAWDLDQIEAKYDALIDRFTGMTPAKGDEMLFAHTQLVNVWQRFPFMDPHLPEALLPDWIGRRAVRLVSELRREWYDDAQARWHEIAEQGASGETSDAEGAPAAARAGG